MSLNAFCEINLDRKWSENCFKMSVSVAHQGVTFSIIDRKIYVPVVPLSTQDNAELFGQLKSGFKRTISCTKYQ